MGEYLDGRIATPTPDTLEWLRTAPAEDEGVKTLKDALETSSGTLIVRTRWHNHDDFYWLKFTTTGDWAYPADAFTLSEPQKITKERKRNDESN